MYKLNVSIFKDLRNFLDRVVLFPDAYVEAAGAFSRQRKLGLRRLVLFIVGLPKRSLHVELLSFFDQLSCLSDLCSKSAFSQARQKLSPLFFLIGTAAYLTVSIVELESRLNAGKVSYYVP